MPARSPTHGSAPSSRGERGLERAPPLGVDAAHAAQMTREVPLADELVEDELVQRRREDVAWRRASG